MCCNATVALLIVSDSPIGLHLVFAVLVRRELLVDLLRKAACCLLASMPNGHLEMCSSIGMYRVPVQDVTREIDKPAHRWGSLWNLAMYSII